MAAIRHSLQKDVFQPLDERLLAVCHVSKLLKKKKISFLCVVTTVKPPYTVTICQVKQNDKNVFKKKRSWPLSDLKIVDGKNTNSDNHEFDIHIDKTYRWLASNLQERQNFFITLWKQCCKHLPKQKPIFRNIPEDWISEIALSPENVVTPVDINIENIEINEDFQAITEKEQADLAKLIEGCDFAISDAERFMEVLAKDLSILDGQNVQIILASEQKVESLMQQLEVAEQEASMIESRLAAYDEVLCNVREAMQSVEHKNLLISIAHQNNKKLLHELENIITQLDLPSHHQAVLDDPELTTQKGLQAAIAAGKALRAAMNCSLQPALLKLAAVREQRKRFERWHAKFSKTISRHLNNSFIHLGNDMGITSNSHGNELQLPQHNTVHKELTPYTELMHWLKVMDNKSYMLLRKVYEDNLGKLYERDFKKFFEDAKQHISGTKRGSGSREDLNTISSSVSRLRLTSGKPVIMEGPLLGIEREQWPPQSLDMDQAERHRCDAVLERALAELEPVCLKEQQFCVAFFQLDVLSPTSKNMETTLYETINRSESDGTTALMMSSTTVIPQKRIEKQINEEVRRMMGVLFACLEPELNNFIAHYEKLDSFYCMNVFVRLSQHVMSAQDTGSFLSMTFASVLVQVKRNFDDFMKAQKSSIENTKVNRKSKCGILPYVENFEEFAKTAESIFKLHRRPDIEKWYVILVGKMFEMIPLHASEHHKTPPEVVKMENFHHLYALLSQLKISVLDGLRKDAKQKYNDALKAYVTQYFGRPLEKLNQFFEGVQAKVNQGVKESEIGYQLAFSKQELRKVIQQYPAREVKKGLENLYRKVEKHLCEEENLLQVVWRAMQEEFIMQYKNLEELIQHCYPGSMIALDFTIEDLLHFFSEIARSH